MRFSRVSIIGTLAAAALTLLVILPILAATGENSLTNGLGDRLTVHVVKEGAAATATAGPTKLGSILYVSNIAEGDNRVNDPDTPFLLEDTPTYNTVRVAVDLDGGVLPTEGGASRLVRVTSDTGEPIWLAMGVDDLAEKQYSGQFTVIEPASAGSVGVAEIEALHGDIITVTAIGVRTRLTVDGEGPTFSDVSPRRGTLQSSSSATLEFTVTDADSGLRTDLEEGTDLDVDNQPNEPLTKDTTGAAEDVSVVWQGVGDDESSGTDWDELDAGRSYSLEYDHTQLSAGRYTWYIEAFDRVGNYSRTDASSRSGVQAYTLTVDNVDPMVEKLYAGLGFDEEDGEETHDSSSILLIFANDDTAKNDDYLDTSTVLADRFAVAGNEVIDVIHPNLELAINDEALEEGDSGIVPEGSVLVGVSVVPVADETTGDTKTDFTVEKPDSAAVGGFTYSVAGTAVVIEAGDRIGNLLEDLAQLDDTCESYTGSDPDTGLRFSGPALDNPEGCIDTRNRVYLVLANPLAAADTPEVHIVGTVRDEAGNSASLTDDLEAQDRISPTLTVGISGDVETDGRPLAREEITVTIASDERLTDDPGVWLVMFNEVGVVPVNGVEEGDVSSDGENAWEVTFEGVTDGTSVAAIMVWGEDRRDNVTSTTGWNGRVTGPVRGDELNLAKLDEDRLIVEFDDAIPDGNVTLNPSVGDAEDAETDSFNPFIELTFGEGKENTVDYTVTESVDGVDTEVEKTADSYEDDKRVETKFDSYGRVELSDVTLDGEDVTDLVARTSSSAFDLALYGLAVGDHTLEFTATDTAGNSTTQEYDFEVLPPSAYEVTLRPGWNLVSFPGNPEDTAIDSVLPADHPATDVLAYDAGVWSSAARGEGNVWEGDLTDIDGDHAYWINTTSTRPLEAVLIQPGIGSASRPPSIQLIAGWNLIPVTDLDQEDEETTQDNYFSSMEEEDFVVAYTYDARTRSWERLDQTGTDVSDDDDPAEWVGVVENGQGVWVFSRSNVILIP